MGGAWVVEGGRVARRLASGLPAADEMADCGGRPVLPGFVDSHAHSVFAGERSAEFARAGWPARALPRGRPRSTVAATRQASDRQLR